MSLQIDPTRKTFFGVVAIAAAVVIVGLIVSRDSNSPPGPTPTLPLCQKKEERFVPDNIKYVPPHTEGDREFDGHGPDVWTTVTLLNRGTQVDVEIYMKAVETESDWTKAEGATIKRMVYTPPSGWRVGRILNSVSAKDYYRDTDHETELRNPGDPVDQLEIVGDQKGDDAGEHTGVTVHFGYVKVELVEVGNCRSPYSDSALVGSPGDWLPDAVEVPYELEFRQSLSYSNEEFAKQYQDPVETLNKLNAWGRVSGHVHLYRHEKGCEAEAGIVAVELYSELYETSKGSDKGFEWIKSNAEENPQARQFSVIDDVGESALIFWNNRTDACNPTHDLRTVKVVFQRYTGIGTVTVVGIEQTVDDRELESVATGLAQIIDSNLQSRLSVENGRGE